MMVGSKRDRQRGQRICPINEASLTKFGLAPTTQQIRTVLIGVI
jgi:hypothetical protein